MIKCRPLINKKAFSLVEISVVILIISLLISGISRGIDLYNDYRITNAKSLTLNSRVGRINNLALWLETLSDKSFDKNDSVNGKKISNWYNINPMSINRDVATVSSESFKPTYIENGINGLPTLKFDGGDYLKVSSLKLKGNLFTFYLVAKRLQNVNDTSVYILTKSTNANDWQYSDGLIPFYEYAPHGNIWAVGTSIDGAKTGAKPSLGQPYIISVIMANLITKIFLNDKEFDPKVIGSFNFDLDRILIGVRWTGDSSNHCCHFNGEVGEIIIYDRDLNSVEHKEVLAYLAQKWSVKK